MKFKIPSLLRCLVVEQLVTNVLFCCLLSRHANAEGFRGPNFAGPNPETLELIQSRGFNGELYTIRSLDGTPLSVFHIINPLADPRTLNRHPALVFHGLGGDSSQMVTRSLHTRPRKPVVGSISYGYGDDENMAFMLSNNNFDVWLCDVRGTNLHNHNASDDLNLLKAQEFWNFSLDEESMFDLPAIIDFILAQTQSNKLVYVGYSESTFFMFALLTKQPQYADKLATFVALAPIAYVSHLQGFGRLGSYPTILIPEGFNENYFPQPLIDTVGVGLRRFCSLGSIFTKICGAVTQGIVGDGEGTMSDSTQFYTTIIKSTSIKSLKHFVQLHFQGRFGMYDYGPQLNLIKYGQVRPPDYDLGKIRLPTIILARGGKDFLSNPEDQEILISQLGVRPYLDIKLPKYNHLDFVLAENIGVELNIPLLKAIFGLLMANNHRESLLRDSSKPMPPKVLQPSLVSNGAMYPQDSEFHLFKNLFEGLGLRQDLNKLERVNPLLGAPLKIVNDIGNGFDSLGGKINFLPDTLKYYQKF